MQQKIVGFVVELSKKNLQVGELCEIFISFFPEPQSFPQIPKAVEEEYILEVNQKNNSKIGIKYCFQVQHGSKIPLNIKAFVCTPKISYHKTLIDFGDVKCCDCLKKSIVLKNEYVTPSKPCFY